MRYDLHVHTKYSKPCGHMEPTALLKIAKKRNLNGIAVCDHDTIRGGLATAKLNKNRDFEVVPGIEIRTPVGDVLLYYAQEEIKSRDLFDVLDEAKQQDCIVVIPHAWRWWPLFKAFNYPLRKIRKMIHGLEILNGRNFFWMNWPAKQAAMKLGIARIAGSDAHFGFEIGRVYSEFDNTLREAIKKNSIRVHGTSFFGIMGAIDGAIRRKI